MFWNGSINLYSTGNQPWGLQKTSLFAWDNWTPALAENPQPPAAQQVCFKKGSLLIPDSFNGPYDFSLGFLTCLTSHSFVISSIANIH